MAKKDEQTYSQAEEDTADKFDEIAGLLREVQEQSEIDGEKLENLNNLIDSLSPDAQRAFADLPVVQEINEKLTQEAAANDEVPCGTIMRVGKAFAFKKPWNRAAQKDTYKMVTISSATKEWVQVNGIAYDIPGDYEEVEVPEVVAQILQQKRETLAMSDRKAKAGALPGGVKFTEVGWAGKEQMVARDSKE
jgi:hypothetical protein